MFVPVGGVDVAGVGGVVVAGVGDVDVNVGVAEIEGPRRSELKDLAIGNSSVDRESYKKKN